MSEFDKEAEREKLREKYGEEQADREATQQMSELLLQGATMTNRHCDRCGNPIFRYDGQEFCPHCQQTGEENAGDAQRERGSPQQRPAEDAGSEGSPGEDAPAQSERSQGGDAPAQSGQADRSQTDHSRSQDSAGPPQDRDSTGSAGQEATPDSTDAADREADRRRVSRPETGARDRDAVEERPTGERSDEAPVKGDLADGEAALRRTLTKFARRAEATDDPRRAKDHLAAAREAAEALAALRR